jgi:hypothetical protein
VRNYSARLGDRVHEEPVRALLAALVACQLRLEQLQGREDVNDDQLVHLAHTVRKLLQELGLAPLSDPDAKPAADLRSYIASGGERSPVSSSQSAGTDIAAAPRERVGDNSDGQDEISQHEEPAA